MDGKEGVFPYNYVQSGELNIKKNNNEHHVSR